MIASPLTPAEAAVLAQLVGGGSNKEIAHHLGIRSHTVSVHLTRIYRKLGAANRTEAVVKAVRGGLVALPAAEVGSISESTAEGPGATLAPGPYGSHNRD